MRICLIRGRNLASLADAFEVDFERAPLDTAGLFAITGPTGAGKSTVLDAMFLALFDKTPRLSERGGIEIGAADDTAEKISSTNVLTLVPKGAIDAYAEVEFIGTDARRYRATWRTRRARGRASGTLRAQTLELRDIVSDEQLGGAKKTETLEAIKSRLGLDFEQFRRSVVLAQGEFAAFLRAKQDDRAELLERMTGTQLYTAISTRAYARAKAEEEALVALRIRRDAAQPMPDEARALLDGEVGEHVIAIDALGTRLTEAERVVGWHERLALLTRALHEAEVARSQTAEAFDGASTRRAMLERVRAADHVRDTYASAAEAAANARHAASALPLLLHGRSAAEAERARANAAHEEARHALELAARKRDDAEPELRAARALDVRIAAKREEHARVVSMRDEATKAHDAAKRAHLALEAARDAHAMRAETLRTTRARLDAYTRVVSGWDAARHTLEGLAKTPKDVLVALPSAGHTITEALAEAEERARDAVDEEASCVRDLGEAERAVDPSADRAFAEEGALCDRRAKALAACELAHVQWREAIEERARAAADERATREARATFEARAAEATASRLEALKRCDALDALLEELRAIEGLSAHRHLLRDGEPCPLCGAAEHPGATSTSVVSERIARYSRERIDLDAAMRAFLDAARAHTLEASKASLTADHHATRAAQASSRSERARETWTSLVHEGPAIDDDAVALWLESERHTLATSRAALDARASAHATALMRERTARAALTTAQTRTRVAEKVLAFETALAAHAAPLAPIEGVRRRFLEAPRVCITRIDEDVAAFREVERAVATIATEEASLAEQARSSATDLARAAADAETHLTRARVSEAELAGLLGDRGARLGGLSADAFEQALADAITAARAAHANADEARGEAARVHEAAVRDAELGEKNAELLAREAHRANERLERACLERGLDVAGLALLLAHPADWLSAESSALATLEREHAEAASRVAHRTLERDAHLAAQPTDASEEDALTTRDAIRELLATKQGALGALHERIREDDARRDKDREAAAAIEAQAHKTRVWSELRDLIGSADGSKFRKFAQSLTFDALLEAANVHLSELAPRYALMSVPGHDLEVQLLDHDLADEVRAVTSLSGGEGFLVSLSLALGLSSLGNAGTRIDSLFVDEGFGALDMKSLDAALGVLEALQATGRKVGIIAHAPGLDTRVGAQVRVIPTGSGRSRIEITR